MRKYYSEFVKHCARFYFSAPAMPNSLSDRVNYNNYVSVSNVLAKYEKDAQNIIRQAYTTDYITKTVENIAKQRSCTSESVWYIIQKFEKDVAIERGLL